MRWRDLLTPWGLTKLNLKAGFVDIEFQPQDDDRKAAWELYVELATRVASQPLAPDQGIDKAALGSLYSLFETTRQILKHYGPGTRSFAPVAIAVLNDVLRPFLARWHESFDAGQPLTEAASKQFRRDLEQTRQDLLAFVDNLAQIADAHNPRGAP
jgi:hypothetical protein